MLPKPPRQLGFQQLTPFRMQKKKTNKNIGLAHLQLSAETMCSSPAASPENL